MIKTAVIVQCRLSSIRFPQKALKLLGDKPLLSYTLNAMKSVPAASYALATDSQSFDDLYPIALRAGYKVIVGPLDDVLARYCIAIRRLSCDVVLRATADNPYLFFDAASDLLNEFLNSDADYMTYTGLPHGSGVEVFKAKSLLKSERETSDLYDREHVGPALYNHKDRYKCIFKAAPKKYYFPNLRTTVDTPHDYRIAQCVYKKLCTMGKTPPYKTADIVKCATDARAILFIPNLASGTGHVARCTEWANILGGTIYNMGIIPKKSEFDLIVTDLFNSDEMLIHKLRINAPVMTIDDGSKIATDTSDVALSVIPSLTHYKNNLIAPHFINSTFNSNDLKTDELNDLCESYESCEPPNKKQSLLLKINNAENKVNILITFGGAPSKLSAPVALYFAKLGFNVTVIANNLPNLSERLKNVKNKCGKITVLNYVPGLKNTLYKYDIVVTHYGLTAFEALGAGCFVILASPSKLHKKLARNYGFSTIESLKVFGLNYCIRHYSPKVPAGDGNFIDYVTKIATGHNYNCPVCKRPGSILFRTPYKTYRKCPNCKLTYLAFAAAGDAKYDENYFMDAYRAQYGKTYIEDFPHIKLMALPRLKNIKKLWQSVNSYGAKNKDLATKNKSTKTLLDVGCAYGPFLQAANECGYKVMGLDVCSEAVEYVKKNLGLSAICLGFTSDDFLQEFTKNLSENNLTGDCSIKQFSVITMWYVIEHFCDLDAVLKKVRKLLLPGGVFAFSTPYGSGISAKTSPNKFYTQSPSDHYTIFDKKSVKVILARYGFSVKKIVSTGHHAERFPFKLPKSLALFISKLFNLGDTFEVYAVKR